MTCPYCGKAVTSGSRYCLHCGTRQDPEYIFEGTPEPKAEPVRPAAPVAAPAAPAAAPAAPVAQKPKPAAKPAAVKPQRMEVNKLQLPTKRGLGKMFFLGVLTAGIYPMVIWSRIVMELNLAACRYDGKRTVSFFGMVMLAPLTLGILPLVWMHNFCCRVGDDLQYRRINYKFGPKAFWLWGVLGSLILVGPFIFTHKLMKSMNLLNDDFNRAG